MGLRITITLFHTANSAKVLLTLIGFETCLHGYWKDSIMQFFLGGKVQRLTMTQYAEEWKQDIYWHINGNKLFRERYYERTGGGFKSCKMERDGFHSKLVIRAVPRELERHCRKNRLTSPFPAKMRWRRFVLLAPGITCFALQLHAPQLCVLEHLYCACSVSLVS